MMNLRIESPHFTADQKLLDYIEKKIGRLDHYYDRILDGEITLKLENSGQVRDKIVDVKLYVPGTTLISKEVNKTFEAAVDVVSDMLKRQIIKFKELQNAHR